MRLGIIKSLSVFKHLRWRLGLWAPLAGRRHRVEEVALRAVPESTAPDPVQVSTSMPPSSAFAEPTFEFGGAGFGGMREPAFQVATERVTESQAHAELDISDQLQWSSGPVVVAEPELEPMPVSVLQEVDEGAIGGGVYQEEPRLSGWKLVLIGIVVVLVSLGSFFI